MRASPMMCLLSGSKACTVCKTVGTCTTLFCARHQRGSGAPSSGRRLRLPDLVSPRVKSIHALHWRARRSCDILTVAHAIAKPRHGLLASIKDALCTLSEVYAHVSLACTSVQPMSEIFHVEQTWLTCTPPSNS